MALALFGQKEPILDVLNFQSYYFIDADENTFNGSSEAHCLHLDASGEARGAAALPMLAQHRLSEGVREIQPLLDKAELVVLMTCLGGGVGSGASSRQFCETC